MAISAEITDSQLFSAKKKDGTVVIIPRGFVSADDPVEELETTLEAYVNEQFVDDGRHFKCHIYSTSPLKYSVWSGPLTEDPDDAWWEDTE
jgi:hypothetical protein